MKIICLSAGHSESDPGAVGNGLIESDITGDIVGRVATKLSAYDCDVRQVPRTDSLQTRCDYANVAGADCFVSIHINAAGGTGFESYIYPGAGGSTQALQEYLHEACMQYSAQHGLPDRGKKAKPFTVLAETAMPACLLELCFIDNEHDAACLRDELYLSGISSAIAHGIVKAMGLTLREPEATEAAIDRLHKAGVINSPDYWLENARTGKTCRGDYVAALIKNMSSKL